MTAPQSSEIPPIRVLLVEDEIAHAKLLLRACRNTDPPVNVVIADSLAAAREQLARELPDILICDLVLPDGRGTTLIPSASEVAHYPVIVVTAQGSERDAVEAIKGGAFDYVVKTDQVLADMPHAIQRTMREWNARRQLTRAQAELQEALQTARDILDSLPAPIALIDKDSNVLAINRSWRSEESISALFGAACPVSTSYIRFCLDRNRRDVADAVRDSLNGSGTERCLEWSYSNQRGETWFELQIRPFREGIGRWILIHADITHRRRVEAEAQLRADALAKISTLSPRQFEVMNMMVNGMANREIAERINRAVKTVEMHRSNLIKELGANSSADVVRLALIAYPELRNNAQTKGRKNNVRSKNRQKSPLPSSENGSS